MKTLQIGPRILKTGVSVGVSIFLAMLLLPGSAGILAAIAALNSTLPSLKKSYEAMSNRLKGTVVGAIIAVGMVYFFQSTPLPDYILIGITCIVTIAVLNLLNLSDVISLSLVAVIVIMLGDPGVFMENALYRVIETFIGVIVSFLINWLVFPPRYEINFVSVMEYITSENLRLIRATLRRNSDFKMTHSDLRWSWKQMAKLDLYLSYIKNEMIVRKKNQVAQKRKIVIFRQMRTATRQSIMLLDDLHHNGDLFNHLPDDTRIMIRERIEVLLVAHEQIILKLSGKIAPNCVRFMEITPEYRERYIRSFYDEVWKMRHHSSIPKRHGLVHLMSAIYRYEEELKRLNRLMDTYKRFHQQGYTQEFDHSMTNQLR